MAIRSSTSIHCIYIHEYACTLCSMWSAACDDERDGVHDNVMYIHVFCSRCLAQSPSNTNLDNATQALLMAPNASASAGGSASAPSHQSVGSEVFVKTESGGKGQVCVLCCVYV